MFGYLVKYPIRIDELKQHLPDAKITLVEQRPVKSPCAIALVIGSTRMCRKMR